MNSRQRYKLKRKQARERQRNLQYCPDYLRVRDAQIINHLVQTSAYIAR